MAAPLPSRTTTLLLEKLHEENNHDVWVEFDARYRPIILGVARRLGLSDSDAADVAQETLLQFVRDYRKGSYDRNKGRLRSWVIGIARHRVIDMARGRKARKEQAGVTALGSMPGENELESVWDEEVERAILRDAMGRLRSETRTSDRTIEAFELFVLKKVSAAEVATSLGMTPHDVYMAKKRVAEKLREIVDEIRSLYVETA